MCTCCGVLRPLCELSSASSCSKVHRPNMASTEVSIQIHPYIKHNRGPFHTFMLPCVSTFLTDKSLLLLLLWFCLTCVFMSAPHSTSEVMKHPVSSNNAEE